MNSTLSTHYILRKLHSISGILPVGVFLLEHLFTNSFAIQGAESYDGKIEFLQSFPYLVLFELVFIIVPILFHGIYGLVITAGMGSNVHLYPRVRNWMYAFQRASGMVAFAYIFYHVYTLRVCNLLFGAEVSFQKMTTVLENGWVFAFYVVGLFAAVFHLTNGIWNFCITWGITIGHSAQRAAAWTCTAFGAALFLAGLNSLLAFVGCAVVF
ncbi:MAG: succinate dehydrogenase [bacterium]